MSRHPSSVTKLVRYTSPIEELPARHFLDGDHGQSKPLPFDRVVRSLPSPDTMSLLFSLPVEIIDNIARFIAPECLSNLALVCRHCLQLSRSLRFADFFLNYGRASRSLLDQLSREAKQALRDDGVLSLPPLGCCVKRLFVWTFVDFIEEHHKVNLYDRDLTDDMRARLEDADNYYFGNYLPALDCAIANALPNLDVLSWRDATILTHSFLVSLTESSITRLTLSRVTSHEEFRFNAIPQSPYRSMRLRYLDIDMYPRGPPGHVTAITTLCSNLLRLNAETLEELRLQGFELQLTPHHLPLRLTRSHDLGWLRLHQLRKLKLMSMVFPDYDELIALFGEGLNSRLVELELDTGTCVALKRFLEARGMIPSLRVFTWNSRFIDEEQQLEFLRQNSQITDLHIPHPMSTELLTDRVLPLLSTKFRNLMTLDVWFSEPWIPSQGLNSIRTLRQLTQLRLSAGSPGYDNRWLPDHLALQSWLSGMHNLRKLAFDRDFYSPGGGLRRHHVDKYYSLQVLIPEDEEETMLYNLTPEEQGNIELAALDPRANSEDNPGFLRVHKHRMIKEALVYAQILPNLEWIYVGQRCFTFQRRADEPPSIASEHLHKLGPYEQRRFRIGLEPRR